MQCDPKKVTQRDFEKLEFRVGKIKGSKLHENGREFVLLIDLGPAERDVQVIADLGESYDFESLIGKQCIVLLNICSDLVDNVESTALLLLATKDNKPILVSPEKDVPVGEKIIGMMDSEVYHFDDVGE